MAQATGSTLAWEQWPGAQEVVGMRQRLARGEGAVAYQEGRALPYGEVALLAQRLLGEVATPASGGAEGVTSTVTQAATPGRDTPLTKRERDVLQLVAQGLSSKAIGRKLFISERTVAQHLTAIFNKLGASRRAQAVAVAAQRGLL
jgi:DNA-binding CsgD family transcriptional regulator